MATISVFTVALKYLHAKNISWSYAVRPYHLIQISVIQLNITSKYFTNHNNKMVWAGGGKCRKSRRKECCYLVAAIRMWCRPTPNACKKAQKNHVQTEGTNDIFHRMIFDLFMFFWALVAIFISGIFPHFLNIHPLYYIASVSQIQITIYYIYFLFISYVLHSQFT